MSLWGGDMRATLHLRRFLRMEDHGRRPVYGEPEAHPCRWEPGARRVQDVSGRQVVGQGTLYTTAEVTPDELPRLLLWLPGDNPAGDNRSRKALQVYVRTDLETGAFDHCEVVL